ncbi:MAG: CoB--CoM heterodisulfide reductase iron-sulfur subunit A family protein, partial [Bacteroidales bacterium]|nr:CoB--CoM heterodisulfide reductase iron-sulfur subunit A family protein [Bacteroidales bacterium]
MGKQTGIYICSGCDIGKSLDLEALATIAIKEYSIPVCKKHHFLCSDEAIKIIQEDIAEKSIDTLVICACSPRAKSDTFSFGKSIQVERVNLREQVVWSHQAGTIDTQMLAEDYLRMGIAKTEKISIPKPYIKDNLNADILVVGGGITGITAAIESAKAGYNVILVEKEKKLGGWAGKLFMQVPLSFPYNQLEDPVINTKMKELEEIDSITVFTSTVINSISGEPGLFNVDFSANGNPQTLSVGAIISATGWKPYDAANLTELGYNNLEDVITGVDFEALAKTGKITRPSDNKKVKSVVFVQCAGSRDEKHLPYCSNFCCMTSLKQARYIRSLNEEANVYIIYQDIRTPGQYEQFYQQVQQDERLFLTKGTISGIHQHNGQILVNVQNTLLGEKISIVADMVVLATGMTPNNSEELNLSYRQGKGLPMLKYDFPDSHFICFPYETRRTGIYAAGALRAPMDIAASIEDATGAALKAIQ